MAEPKITSIETLQGYAQGQVVELPPFAEGQPFVARICRPSMLVLTKSGKIPNSLLTTANDLFFEGKPNSRKTNNAMSEVYDVIEVFCEACFLEPTYSQIKAAGVQLTDDQLMFIFNYAQTGVKALEPFRKQSASAVSVLPR